MALADEVLDVFDKLFVDISGQVTDIFAAHVEFKMFGNVIDKVAQFVFEGVQELGGGCVQADDHNGFFSIFIRIGESGVHAAFGQVLIHAAEYIFGRVQEDECLHDPVGMVTGDGVEKG